MNKLRTKINSLLRWLRARAVAIAMLLLILAWAFILDPATSGLAFTCPFHAWTGLYCPGCGGQRAFHALLHGRVLQAADFNLLFVLVLSGAGLFFVVSYWRPALRGRWWPPAQWVLVLVVAMCLVFGVLRNLPGTFCSWLAP